MTPTRVRAITIGVCVICVAAMIASAITKEVGAVITFGLLSTSAISTLMVTFALVGNMDPASTSAGSGVVKSSSGASESGAKGQLDQTESAARELEGHISALVLEGVPEDRLRALVKVAVKVGKTL